MTNPYLDLILEIRHLIETDRKAMISTEMTSLTPAIEMSGDQLKFIDAGLTELTKKEK